MKGLLLAQSAIPAIQQIGSVIFGGETTDLDKILFKIFNTLVWTGCLLLAAVFINHIMKSERGTRYKSFYTLLAIAAVLFALPFISNTFALWMPPSRFNIMMTLTAGIATWMLVFLKHRLLNNYAEYFPGVGSFNFRTVSDINNNSRGGTSLNVNTEKQKGYIRWHEGQEELEYTEEISALFKITDGSTLSFQKIEELIHPDDVAYVKKFLKQIVVNDQFPVFYCRIINTEGSIVHLSVRGNLSHTNEGKITMIECTVQEVDEEDLYSLKLENERKLEDIAWIQSHKMRAPVASILGLSHLFNKDNPNDPANLEILKGITEAAHTLDTLIKEINAKTSF